MSLLPCAGWLGVQGGFSMQNYSTLNPITDAQIGVILLLLSRLLGWHASVGGFLTSVLLVRAAKA